MTSPSCPKCGAALKDDYGMVHCPKCGTMLFIDMDGQANVGTTEEPESATKTVAPVAPPADEVRELTNFGETNPHLNSASASDEVAPVIDSDFKFATDPEPTLSGSSVIDLNPQAPEQSLEFAPHNSPSEELPPAVVEFEQPAERSPEEGAAEFSMDSMLGYQDAPSEADQIGPVGDPLGLSAYANSEVSQAKDGRLSFKILISGIDSKEMRDSLREAIEDARFGWNASALIAKISKGTLELDHVAPVKATILINRIKRLPVQIRWEQYAVTQMDGD